jgi:hypothetical protein
MGKVMDDAAPSIRSRIAAVLAKSGTGNALVMTAHTLLDADPKVVDAAARSLAAEVPSFSAPQRHALGKFLIESLQGTVSVKAEAALVRVLGTLHEAGAEEIFWSKITPSAAAEVRSAALQALGTQTHAVSEARLQKLLACAAAKDFQTVAPALMILKSLPLAAKQTKHWLKLLEAPDVATRRFAVEKLRGAETKDVAHAFLAQLRHPDVALRDEVLKALQGFGAGRQALLEQLLNAETPDETWFLARALAPSARQLAATQRQSLMTRAGKDHEKEDRRAGALWFLLRESDADWTRDQIEARALTLRKKKDYAGALSYFRLLAQDPACSEETRFELAATGLKESDHDLAADARANEPALHQFTRLLQNAAFDLLGKLVKAKWLEPADLFYLGFHFAEQAHRAREFGGQVLELVVKRSPKSEFGKQAKRKLKSEGF